MKDRKRVLICYTELLHYRVEVLKALARHYDLTVVHSGKNMTGPTSVFREVVMPLRVVWRFRFQTGLLKYVRNERFDTLICFFDLAWVSIVVSFFVCPRNARRITWGLWRTQMPLANWARRLVARLADANIFYSTGTAQEFVKRGTPKEKVYVARNTVFVANPGRNESSIRDSVLFVGSFDMRKRNDVTVLAFAKAVTRIKKIVRLVFVGDGACKHDTVLLAKQQKCYDRIEFYAFENDPDIIRGYYDRAICSVSFGQAGLSVLQSFGYGVPFVTHKDAISGGEIENIIDGYNGVLCDSNQESLEHVLVDLCSNQILSTQLGRNAVRYYKNNASVDVMVSGFVSAIESQPELQKSASPRC